MTREDIIRMAREQGLPETEVEGVFMVNTDDLGRFAAAEREACAKVCDGIRYSGYCPPEDGSAPDYYNEATQECAEAIRARGEK